MAEQPPRTAIFEKVDEDQLQTIKQASSIKQALVWVHKAKAGSCKWVDNCSEEQFNYYCLSKKMKLLGTCAKYGLLVASICDMPSWCRGTPEACSTYVQQLYSPGFTVLPPMGGAILSLVFYGILLVKMHVRKLALADAYSISNWQLFTATILILGFFSALVSLAFPMVYTVSVLCRPFAFLGCTKSLRKGTTHVVTSIPGFIDVLIALAICVVIVVWMGMVMYCRTAEGAADFFAWRQGFAQMWILFTTNNTPNVIMPAYQENRGNFFFFLIYLIVTVFLLGNVLLGKVYDTYKDVLCEDMKQHMEHQRVSVTRAFTLLADKSTGCISASTWREFFVAYFDPDLGSIQVGDASDMEYNVNRANAIMKKLHDIDVDGGMEYANGINFEHFRKITNVFFNDGIYVASKKPPATESRIAALGWLHEFFSHGYTLESGRKITWDGTMDGIITVGTILIFRQTWIFAHTWNTEHVFLDIVVRPFFWVLFFFSLVYTFAISVKISILGFERFWHKKPFQHRFDFFNVYGLFFVSLAYVFVYRGVAMYRLFAILQMARGLRLFAYVEPLQSFFALMVKLIPIYTQMGMILFIVYWVFCDIGQLAFGGMIYSSNPALAHTDFAHNANSFYFFELNFNCFLDGMVTLFTLMCMNNWSDTADGYMKASQAYYGYWSQLFFVSFTLICNMIVLNILIALILDCTGIVKEECAAELEASRDGVADEGEDVKAQKKVDVLAALVGAEEEGSDEDSSDASSEESGEELDENIAKTMTATSSMARKKKGGAKKSLAPDLTRAEKKSFDNRQAIKTSKKGRKSIG